jgi:hypothetical protein
VGHSSQGSLYALLALLDDSPRRLAMGEASRRTIIEKCPWEVTADSMNDVLHAIAGTPKTRV